MPTNSILPKRKKIRLEDFNYSLEGNYFITIVTQDRMNLFGEIADGEMKVNSGGKTIAKALADLPKRFTGAIISHYVIMPNHIHFILYLPGNIRLSDVIRVFKSISTVAFLKNDINDVITNRGKLWQRNYYEHIIRNPRSYDYIVQYINTNPSRWEKDKINIHHDSNTDEIMKEILEIQ